MDTHNAYGYTMRIWTHNVHMDTHNVHMDTQCALYELLIHFLSSQSVFDKEPSSKARLSARTWGQANQDTRLLPYAGLGKAGTKADCIPVQTSSGKLKH